MNLKEILVSFFAKYWQLKMEVVQFHDGRVLDNPNWQLQLKKYKDISLAVKCTAYRTITADFKDFFIKELHRIKTAINNHGIEYEATFFKRYKIITGEY